MDLTIPTQPPPQNHPTAPPPELLTIQKKTRPTSPYSRVQQAAYTTTCTTCNPRQTRGRRHYGWDRGLVGIPIRLRALVTVLYVHVRCAVLSHSRGTFSLGRVKWLLLWGLECLLRRHHRYVRGGVLGAGEGRCCRHHICVRRCIQLASDGRVGCPLDV